jgi:hypothetical protein
MLALCESIQAAGANFGQPPSWPTGAAFVTAFIGASRCGGSTSTAVPLPGAA